MWEDSILQSMKYEDDPQANLKELKALNKEQLCAYVKGYIMACTHMREALSKGKYDLLTAQLKESELNIDSVYLGKAVKLLDIYEDLVVNKERNLISAFPEFLSEYTQVSQDRR